MNFICYYILKCTQNYYEGGKQLAKNYHVICERSLTSNDSLDQKMFVL